MTVWKLRGGGRDEELKCRGRLEQDKGRLEGHGQAGRGKENKRLQSFEPVLPCQERGLCCRDTGITAWCMVHVAWCMLHVACSPESYQPPGCFCTGLDRHLCTTILEMGNTARGKEG